MIKDLIDDLKAAPSKLTERRDQVVRRARERAHKVRGDGQIRIWTLKTTTLEGLEGLLSKGDELPVLKRFTTRAGKAVHTRLEAVTAVPIEDYEDRTAKQVISDLHKLGSRVALLNVRRFESAHKARKTVLSAIEHELHKLDRLPEAVAA